MKIREECHNCGYYNSKVQRRYKCYTSECPAYIRDLQEKEKQKKKGRY